METMSTIKLTVILSTDSYYEDLSILHLQLTALHSLRMASRRGRQLKNYLRDSSAPVPRTTLCQHRKKAAAFNVANLLEKMKSGKNCASPVNTGFGCFSGVLVVF